jgi:hypothetical protein
MRLAPAEWSQAVAPCCRERSRVGRDTTSGARSTSECQGLYSASRVAAGCIKLTLPLHRVCCAWRVQNYQPLHCAAENGHASVVTLLLEHGARVNARIRDVRRAPTAGCIKLKHSRTPPPLHRVRCAWRVQSGSRPLHLAAHQHHASVVTVLLEHGGNVNAADHDGATPLTLVVQAFHAYELIAEDMYRYVLEHDALDAFVDDEEGHFGDGVLRTSQLLLEGGAHLAANIGAFLVQLAVVRRNRELVFLLLRRGALVIASMGNLCTLPAVAAGARAAQHAIGIMLLEWPRGGLFLWRREVHAAFPATFRANIAATLLATLGSMDASAAAAQAADNTAEPVAGRVLASHRSVLPQRSNPLRTLQEEHVLVVVFKALLIAHGLVGPLN